MRRLRTDPRCAALVLAGVAAACGGHVTAPDPPTHTESASAAREAAPEFSLPGLDGREVRLADFEGSIRLVDFWATWCAPCREEIPMLNELQASYGERGFRILAISEEEADVIREFVEREEVRYLNLVGTAEVAEAYGVLGLPSAYLLDREGRVVETFVGPKPRRVLVERIEALLAASPAT
jgi:thiol-disulfide isomerase/thioredoxin